MRLHFARSSAPRVLLWFMYLIFNTPFVPVSPWGKRYLKM
jgi:hypothetical protein